MWPTVATGWDMRPPAVLARFNGTRRCGPGDAISDQSCALCDVLLNTRKWDARCSTVAPERNRPERPQLLVTGIGGTGTNTITTILNRMGVKVKHEMPGLDGSVSWPMAVNDAYVNQAYPWSGLKNTLGPDELIFTHVAHVVRCPLDNIATLTTHKHATRHFMASAGVPEPAGRADFGNSVNERVAWASLAWIAWNEHVERYADYRFQTESLPCPDGELHLRTTLWRSGFGDGLASAPAAGTSSAGRPVHTPSTLPARSLSSLPASDRKKTAHLNVRSHIRGISLANISRAFNESGYALKYAPELGPHAGELVVARLRLMARAYGYGDQCLAGHGPARNCSGADGGMAGIASEHGAGFFDIMG